MIAVVAFHHIDQIVSFSALLLSPCHYEAIAIHPGIRGQVLLLTHTEPSAHETLPYAAHFFSPIPVIAFYVGGYKEEPTWKSEESVWYAWKDIITRDDEELSCKFAAIKEGKQIPREAFAF